MLFGAGVVGVFVVCLRRRPLLHRVLLRGVRHARLILNSVLAGVLTCLGRPFVAAIGKLAILAIGGAGAR